MNRSWWGVLTLLFIVFTSCNKDNLEEELAAENQKLAAYMQEIEFPGADTISDHIYVRINSHTEGMRPKAGEFVLINLRIQQLYDNILEYDNKNPDYRGNIQDGPEMWQLSAPLLGLSKAIGQMREGENADIYLPSYYYNRDRITRLIQIELLKVVPDIASYQESLMKWYMKDYKKFGEIDTIESTAESKKYKLLYSIIDEGDGQKIESTSSLKLSWSASYILQEGESNIKLYQETKESSSFPAAFEKVLLKMNTGGKVFITMPYILAYGTVKYANDIGQYIIPPESPIVVFEVTVK